MLFKNKYSFVSVIHETKTMIDEMTGLHDCCVYEL
jgi:hypothetical protein